MGNLELIHHQEALLSEKEKIWNRLNEERLLRQRSLEKSKSVSAQPKVYIFKNIPFYKIQTTSYDFYIKVKDYEKITLMPSTVTLHRFGYINATTKPFYIKKMKHTDKVFLCETQKRDYFKPYAIEKERLATNKL